jgi:hypothetical protein
MPPGEAASEPGCVYTCQHMEGIQYIYICHALLHAWWQPPCASRLLTKNPAQNEESLKCISKLFFQGTLRSPSIIIIKGRGII